MIREGSLVRFQIRIGGKLGRPGVVVRTGSVDGVRVAQVAWGTGTLRTHRRHVAVVPSEPAGRAMGLKKPTYFYGNNVWLGLPESLQEQRRLCPSYLLVGLWALIDG